jgi:hypothetical protein
MYTAFCQDNAVIQRNLKKEEKLKRKKNPPLYIQETSVQCTSKIFLIKLKVDFLPDWKRNFIFKINAMYNKNLYQCQVISESLTLIYFKIYLDS